MTVTVIVLAVVAGLVIGFSMGALGGGGAIIAVPVLVYGLHQAPVAATTASLVIVCVTAVAGVISAARLGNVRWPDGLAFGVAAVVGTSLGALASARVAPEVLMACFAGLMLIVATVMLMRLWRGRTKPRLQPALVSLRPFSVDWARLVKVLGVATVVGLLTGFLGVGGGFMIVPALTVLLGLPIRQASATSLLVLIITTGSALLTRAVDRHAASVAPDWGLVGIMLGCAVVASIIGTLVAQKARSHQLEMGFAGLVMGVAIYTAARVVPTLL